MPIVAISLDMGFDRAIYGSKNEWFKGLKIVKHKYKSGQEPESYKGNDITVYEIPAPLQLDPNRVTGYMEVWAYWIKIFGQAVQDPEVRTLGVDTMTLLTKYCRDAYLQELQLNAPAGKPARKQLQQIEYGHSDGKIRQVYTFTAAMEKNLVVVHHLRDKYQTMSDGSTQPSGELEHDGVRDIMRLVDVQARNVKERGGITSKILTCGYNLSLEGTTLTDMTWNKLVGLITMSGWKGEPFEVREEKGAAQV